ncbi:MAG: tetratricopeptide repeat protein [Candidatus Eremiobacteraeota bacterium]|nr:tetratricopeptide repeat protein [Candidatus Eremiobacteraeota bacterium]
MDHSFLIKKYQNEAQKNPNDPQSYYYLGLLYNEQRDYQMATSYFSRANSVDPSFFPAHYHSGLAYACLGKPDLGAMEWELSLKHNPRPFDEREPEALPFDYNEAGHAKKAITECLQRKKILPGESQPYYFLALAYLVTGQLPLARKELEDLLVLEPAFIKAYHLMVELYLKLKEPAKAIDVLKKLIKQEPSSFGAHYKLAQLLMQQNEVSTAVPVLQKAHQLKPNNDSVIIELGKAYKLQGKEDYARASYQKALDLNPKCADAYFELGLLYEEKFDFSTAADYYQKAIWIDEKKGEAYSHLGNISKRLGRVHDAIENFKKSVKFFPSDSYQHYQLGEAYISIKKYREATEEFKQAISHNPKDVYSYINLGIALSRIGEYDESLDAFRKALEINPELVDPYYNMALTYLRMGHLTFAREYIEKFLKIKPNDTYAHFALGNIHLRFGDLDFAIQEYKKAIDSYPDHPYARFNLASSYARAGQYDLAENEFSKALEHNPPESEDEMILFATMASYHTILQTLAKAISELKTYFQLYEDAKIRYQGEEKVKNRITELFKKFLPETVAEGLITQEEDLGDVQREVTVVFSDIRGYTTLTEIIGARDAMKILNDYYSSMSKISTKFGGTLLYFQGDAQMVIFGAPLEDRDHPLNALRAAMEMKTQVSYLSDKWFKDQARKFEIAVGITTGDVVMGFINDGTRLQYTAIGDTVNVAARLQDVSKEHNSAVMLNEKAYERVKEHVTAQRLDSIHLKGKSESVNVYKIESVSFPS